MFAFAALLSLSMFAQTPPPGAIVLFDGSSTDAWVHRGSKQPCQWEVLDGAMVVKAGTPDIMTQQEFRDYRLHLEFWLPLEADKKDQGRANSGVYNQGRYEIQILDNWQNATYAMGGCGALYGLKDPESNAIKPPETWNSYDIVMRGAKVDSQGNLLVKPRISVWHNGLRIHNDFEIPKSATTAGLEGPWATKGPIMLQNHGSAIRFRNIWLVPLDN